MYGTTMGRLSKPIYYNPNSILFWRLKGANLMIKSIEIESHFQVGISNNLSSPMGCCCSALTFWQVKHRSTNFAISLFMLSYQKYCFKSRYIFFAPGCIEYRMLWASVSIFSFNSVLSGTHKWVYNLNVPSTSTTKPGTYLSPNFAWFSTVWHPPASETLFLLIEKVAPLR